MQFNDAFLDRTAANLREIPDFIGMVRKHMAKAGMTEPQIDDCLAKFLPQVRERAAKGLH